MCGSLWFVGNPKSQEWHLNSTSSHKIPPHDRRGPGIFDARQAATPTYMHMRGQRDRSPKSPRPHVLVSEWMAIGDALDGIRRLTPSNSTHSTEKTWLPDRLSLGTGSDAGWVLQLDRVRHRGESGFRSGGWAIRLKCSPNGKEVYERCR